MVRLAHWVAVLIAACGFVTAFSSPGTLVSDQGDPSVQQLRELFAHPTADCRILMRWWWFGAGITKSEVQRELEAMNAAGIGGVEIATLYPLQLDDEPGGFRNLPYLSDEYLDVLRFANQQAKSLGLRVDVTLGSGWPLGGPHIPVEQAAGRLRVETVAIAENSNTLALPTIAAGEKLVAFFLAPGTSAGLRYADATLLPDTAVDQGWLRIPDSFAGLGQRNVVFFISSRTGMMVKRPAVGAEGFVLDHYDRTATATHLRAVGDRLMTAFVDQPPYAVFSDSLEDYGSNWTPDLLQEFQKRRGYDLKPHLPALIMDAAASGGAETAAIRHDWGKTLTELANEHLLSPLRAWAKAHHTLLRSQSYGFPPVTLSSNQLTDLPEGEGKASFTIRHARLP